MAKPINTILNHSRMAETSKIRLRAVYGIPINKPFIMTYSSPGRPIVESKVYIIVELSGEISNPLNICIKGNDTSNDNYYKDLNRVFNHEDILNKRSLISKGSELKSFSKDIKLNNFLKTTATFKAFRTKENDIEKVYSSKTNINSNSMGIIGNKVTNENNSESRKQKKMSHDEGNLEIGLTDIITEKFKRTDGKERAEKIINKDEVSEQNKFLGEKGVNKDVSCSSLVENNSSLFMQVFEENEDQNCQGIKDGSKLNTVTDHDNSLDFDGKEIKVEPVENDELETLHEICALHDNIETNSVKNNENNQTKEKLDKSIGTEIDEISRDKMKSLETDCIAQDGKIEKEISSPESNSDHSSKGTNQEKQKTVLFLEKLNKRPTRQSTRMLLLRKNNMAAGENLVYTTYIPLSKPGKHKRKDSQDNQGITDDLKTNSEAKQETSTNLDDTDNKSNAKARKDNMGNAANQNKPEKGKKHKKRSHDPDPDYIPEFKIKKKIVMSDKQFTGTFKRLVNEKSKNAALPVVFLKKVKNSFDDDCVRMFIPSQSISGPVKRISIKLSEHQDKFYIEDQVSLKRMDRGKSDSEKTFKLFVCKECNQFRTEDKEQMEIHIEQHVNGELSCDKCEFVGKSLNDMFLHESRSHKKNIVNHRCYICKAEFRILQEYQEHVTQEHGLLPWVCNICSTKAVPVMFENRQMYKEHFIENHKDKLLQCAYCGRYFFYSQDLSRHQCDGKESKNEGIPCDICGKMFAHRASLRKHKNCVHFNIRPFPCTQCNYSAQNPIVLKYHTQAKHKGDHPYKCDQCNYTCVKPSQLQSHKKTHTGDKPYKCDKCPYQAPWNVMLKDHKKLHLLGSMGLECEICSVVVRKGAPFTKHMRKEHCVEVK